MGEIRHVGRSFRIISQTLTQRMQRDHEALGITSTQGYVLGYLSRRQNAGDLPIYAKDVEQHFGVKHSTVSGILQRLESKGFLLIEPDDTDRRCKKILLTEKALQIHGKILENIIATEELLYRDMTEQEQADFTALLQKAMENITGGNTDCPPPLTLMKEDTDPC